jgi:hypothetical protein
MEGLADQLVDRVGAVVLRGVDVVDAELDRPPQHGTRFGGVARRAHHVGAGELHRPEADAADGLVAERAGGCRRGSGLILHVGHLKSPLISSM